MRNKTEPCRGRIRAKQTLPSWDRSPLQLQRSRVCPWGLPHTKKAPSVSGTEPKSCITTCILFDRQGQKKRCPISASAVTVGNPAQVWVCLTGYQLPDQKCSLHLYGLGVIFRRPSVSGFPPYFSVMQQLFKLPRTAEIPRTLCDV